MSRASGIFGLHASLSALAVDYANTAPPPERSSRLPVDDVCNSQWGGAFCVGVGEHVGEI